MWKRTLVVCPGGSAADRVDCRPLLAQISGLCSGPWVRSNFAQGKPLFHGTGDGSAQPEGDTPMLIRCLFLALLLSMMPAGINAQQQSGPFEIPFTFVAYDSDFEPGEYRLEVALKGNLRLVHRDTGRARYLVKGSGRAIEKQGRDALLFERMGNLYVLREIRYGAEGRTSVMPLSKQRSDFVQVYTTQGHRPEPVLISASW